MDQLTVMVYDARQAGLDVSPELVALRRRL
jgi:hypothetical protein